MPGTTLQRAIWAGAALAALLAGLGSGLLVTSLTAHTAGAPVSGVAPPPVAAPGGWWTPLPRATAPFVPAQLVVERLRLQAPVETKGIDAHDAMEVPDRPEDAAWYRFTAMPASGGNAVFSGFRDYGRTRSAAIFLHLDQVGPGDLIDVVSARRTEVRYQVTNTSSYALEGMPMQKVLSADASDVVTLIAPSGAFTAGLGYDHRLVVRAVRVQ